MPALLVPQPESSHEFLSPGVVLVDPAEELAEEIGRWRLPTGGADRFITSGDPAAMRLAARNAFGVEVSRPTRVRITAGLPPETRE